MAAVAGSTVPYPESTLEGVVGAQDEGAHDQTVQNDDADTRADGGDDPGQEDGGHALDVGERVLLGAPDDGVKAANGDSHPDDRTDCRQT